jgi:Tfp pilus assembly protein PilF
MAWGRIAGAHRPAATVKRSTAVLALALAIAGCSHIVVLHDPLTAVEHNDLGVAYERSGHADLAAREYRRALRRNPHFGLARLNLGNVEAAAGRWSAAANSFDRAMRDLPTDPDPPNNLAVALLKLGGDVTRAESLATRAVRLAGPRDSLYRATLADVRAARDTRPTRATR